MGFAACTAHSRLDFACLESGQRDGGVCSESWFELRTEMESGFNGREERDFSPSCSWIPWKNPAKILSMEKTLLCPREMWGALFPALPRSPVPLPALVGMFEPPRSWERGSGSSGTRTQFLVGLRGELGPSQGGLCLSQPCPSPEGTNPGWSCSSVVLGPEALGSLGNVDPAGMGVNP